jgi:hypothetical protein
MQTDWAGHWAWAWAWAIGHWGGEGDWVRALLGFGFGWNFGIRDGER